MRIFGIYNIKGGVGKTTTTVNLAFLSAREGARTLIWDLDPQGGTSYFLCIKPKVPGGAKALLQGKPRPEPLVRSTGYQGLDLLPADLSYRHMDRHLTAEGMDDKAALKRFTRLLKPLSRHYDHLFLDCAPGLSAVAENVFRLSNVLLVPMLPSPLSLRAYNRLVRFLNRRPSPRLKVAPFFNLVNSDKTIHRVVIDRVLERHPVFMRTHLPDSHVIEAMGVKRSPLFTFAPNTAEARAYRELWEEIKGRTL
ncbi:MAG: ParA family protein [Magnetococcales bacterium]|nr:ParA family protein [Magnetococcales bacterium]